MKSYVNKNNISLRNVKFFPSHEWGPKGCQDLDIYLNEKKVAHFHNQGEGGEPDIEYTSIKAKKELWNAINKFASLNENSIDSLTGLNLIDGEPNEKVWYIVEMFLMFEDEEKYAKEFFKMNPQYRTLIIKEYMDDYGNLMSSYEGREYLYTDVDKIYKIIHQKDEALEAIRLYTNESEEQTQKEKEIIRLFEEKEGLYLKSKEDGVYTFETKNGRDYKLYVNKVYNEFFCEEGFAISVGELKLIYKLFECWGCLNA